MILKEGYEDWKIYPLYEVFYIELISSSAESAIHSWEELNEIISDTNLLNTDGLRTIDLSDNIVSQAGILSRYFFPATDKRNIDKNRIHQLRAEKLREFYLIDSANILKNRQFRNYIEHFDENLDKFLNDVPVGNILPKTLYWRSADIDNITSVFKAYVVE